VRIIGIRLRSNDISFVVDSYHPDIGGPQSKTITISRDINQMPFRNDNEAPAAISATT